MTVSLNVLDVYFPGSMGKLHGIYKKSINKNSPCVLILSPDPRQGGTMKNKIINLLFKIFSESDFSTMKIDFKKYENVKEDSTIIKNAESDVATAIDWLQNQNQYSSHFWIVGYSFGSYIAANILMRRPEIENFILISPLIDKFDHNILSPLSHSGLIIHGEKDQYENIYTLKSLVDELNEMNSHQIQLKIIEKADHFYNDSLDELSIIIQEYIDITLAMRVNKPIKKRRRRRRRKDVL